MANTESSILYYVYLGKIPLASYFSGAAWYAGCKPCLPDNHPHRTTSTKCRTNTVISPDDGPIVARNL